MNVLVFYQTALRSELESFIDSAVVAGGVYDDQLVLIYPKYQQAEAAGYAEKIKKIFKNVAMVPVQVNTNLPPGNIAGGMLGSFYFTSIAKFPGAKLLIDGATKVVGQTWLRDIENIHKINGKWFTGRFVKHPQGGVVPVGPFVIDCPVKELRFFTGAAMGIRDRGRWLWNKSFYDVSPRSFPFAVTHEEAREVIAEPTPAPDESHLKDYEKTPAPLFAPKPAKKKAKRKVS